MTKHMTPELTEQLAKYLLPTGYYNIRAILNDENTDPDDPLGLNKTFQNIFGESEGKSDLLLAAEAYNEKLYWNARVEKYQDGLRLFIVGLFRGTKLPYRSCRALAAFGYMEISSYASDGQVEGFDWPVYRWVTPTVGEIPLEAELAHMGL
jgi:hypothetical protein